MKKLKFLILIVIVVVTGFYLDKTKEIELKNNQIGQLYGKYVVTKNKNRTELTDYFNDKKIEIYAGKNQISDEKIEKNLNEKKNEKNKKNHNKMDENKVNQNKVDEKNKEKLSEMDKNNDEKIEKSKKNHNKMDKNKVNRNRVDEKNKAKSEKKKPKKVEMEKIIDIEKNYELVELNKILYLKTKDKIKQAEGEIRGSLRLKNDKRYIFEKNKKYGLFDKNLNVLVKPIYDGIYGSNSSTLLLAKKGEKFGYIDKKSGKEIIPFEYEIGAFEKNGLIIVKKGEMIGVIDKNNKVVVNFDYKAVYYDKGNKFIVLKDKKYYLINKELKKEKLDIGWVGIQRGDKIFYEKDGMFGIYSFKDGYITKNIYKELSQNYTKLIVETKNEKYGLIDIYGNQKLKMQFDYILQIGNNYFKAGKDATGYVCLIDQTGKILTKEIYDDFIELSKKTIVGIKDSDMVLLNDKGRILTKKYDRFIKMNDKNILGIKNDKISLLNEKGKKIKEIQSIIEFNSYMLLYKENGKNILRKI